jgi:hypothetical protein
MALVRCGLVTIPEELTGLSALTSLDLSENEEFDQGEGWPWWPTTLSR